jgi:hypothetical protein
LWGFTLSSSHFFASGSHRAQSRHSISSLPLVVPPIAALLVITAQAPKVTLTFFQEHFIVRDGVYNESAPLQLPDEQPKLSTVFRKNSTFAVWDERGLTIRVDSKVKSTKLPEVATSPKAFTRDEILETQRLVKSGKRTKDVAGLSGALRVGNRVYFLSRWEDKEGKPWAEAIIQVDLTEAFPVPKFLTRVHALSMADKPIDDQIFILDGLLTYVARNKDRWGVQQFDPKSGRFSFDEMGDKLDSYTPLTGNRTGLFVEKTSYGTTVAGRVDLHARFRKTLAETRAKMRFIDAHDPACVVLSFGNAASILNTETGAVYDLAVACATRRTNRGLVIWTPIQAPRRAWLFDPTRWQVKAWWNADISQPIDGR